MRERLFVIVFTCVVLLFIGVNVKGDFEDNINEEESRLDEKEEKLQNIQKSLEELNISKKDLDIYLENLNNSYNMISEYIADIEKEMTDIKAQIEAINAELKRAEEEKNEQYESMKQRIQYMYETGDTQWIFAMFSGESVSDILRKAQYTAELVEYDRKKLEEYEDMLIYIEANKIEMEKKYEEFEKLKSAQDEEKRKIADTMNDAAKNIRNQEEKIDEAESKAVQLAEEIEAGKNQIEELRAEESRRIEESIRVSREMESKKNAGIYEEATTAKPYEATEEEVMKMAAILYCEARGESYQGILAVGSVIMNRIDDPRFPNTLEEVIMSPGQFSPVASGLYAIALAKGANEECIMAAREVLFDGVRIGPWLYFRTVNNIIQGTIIGNHVFYYR